jgi:hypothetical protein
MNMVVVSCSLPLSASSLCLLAKFPQIFKRNKIEFEVIFGVFNAQKKKRKNGLTAIFASS